LWVHLLLNTGLLSLTLCRKIRRHRRGWVPIRAFLVRHDSSILLTVEKIKKEFAVPFYFFSLSSFFPAIRKGSCFPVIYAGYPNESVSIPVLNE
jgi:hypothetical protein